MKKLTSKEIQARLAMFDEAADHLLGDVSEDPIENKQKRFVRGAIINLANQFARKHLSP